MEKAYDGLDRRKFLVGLLFASGAGVAAWREPSKRLDYLGAAKLEKIVPETIGKWKFVASSGLVVPPEDPLSDSLYSQLLTRVYSDGENAPIMLLIAQSAQQTGVLQVHRPEVCYPYGGFALSPITTHMINLGSSTLPTSSLVATGEGITENVMYWTRVGDSQPLTWAQQRIDVAKQNLRGIVPDAVMVRVSVRQSDEAGARKIMDEFVREMMAAVPANKRSVFLA